MFLESLAKSQKSFMNISIAKGANMLTKQQVPNLLTITRIVLIAPILFVLMSPELAKKWVLALFLIAAATDFLDGYFARKWNARSNLGSMLDQISDKLLVVTVLVVLSLYQITGVLTVLVILLREIYVSGLREHMALSNIAMPVSKIGKYKTAVQMTSVGIILSGLTFDLDGIMIFGGSYGSSELVIAGNVLLVIGAVLGVISAVQYTLALVRSNRAA